MFVLESLWVARQSTDLCLAFSDSSAKGCQALRCVLVSVLNPAAEMGSCKLPGPVDLKEVVEWPCDFRLGLQRIDQSHGTSYDTELVTTLRQRNIVLTSSFSGSGAAETALSMLASAASIGVPEHPHVGHACAATGVADHAASTADTGELEQVLSDDSDVEGGCSSMPDVVMYSATDIAPLCQR